MSVCWFIETLCVHVDDGTFYFDEKAVSVGPLATTSSVVQGLTAFASTASGRVNVSSVFCRPHGLS